jgi:serine/threonine-protein kinase RsbW
MDSFSATVRCDVSLLSGLRHALALWLEGKGVDHEPRASAVLATHEAAANAIEHGASGVDVSAAVIEGVLMIEVSDQGQWHPARFDDDERGRGLMLISALVSDLDVSTEPTGTTVRMIQYP